MTKPQRFAHYDTAKKLALTATERILFHEYEKLEAYIEQQEKYRLEAYQRIDDLNKEIERLKFEGYKDWNCPHCGKCESFQVVERHIKCQSCKQEYTDDI